MRATPHWRPRVHFTPRRHWINDPNGLVWHDGEYHLFYQYNPQGDVWGHMSWGHAVSADLFHWQQLPVALPEDEHWMIFSGSVVVDHGNTSGFGDGRQVPMVACYTGCRQGGGLQNQHVAYSLDRGRTWVKYQGNPVLDLGLADFRDPKVFRHDGRWVMLVSMAQAHRLAFFASDDLRAWSPLSEFTVDLPVGCRLWECPDLLRLPIRGENDGHAWVLKFDVFEGHPGGGSGAVAIVGTFDGNRFVATQAPQWVDGGMDFYAAIAFGAMPPGDPRSVWIGWMNDHRHAPTNPTAPWRGAMSVPREMALVRRDGRLVLAQWPVAELAAQHAAAPIEHGPEERPAADRRTLVQADALPLAHEIDIEVASATPTCWRLGVRAGDGEATVIDVDALRGELGVTRRHAGASWAGKGFDGRRVIAWPGAGRSVVSLRVVVDASSVEVFSDDGTAVLSEIVFPSDGSRAIWIDSDAPVTLRRLRAWPLADAMHHAD